MNQLKAGALLSYFSLGLNIILGIIYTPFMLRMMGQAEYGLYSLAFSVVGYLTILDLGFGNAITRYTAKFMAEGKKKEQYEMFGMFFILYLVIGAVALCIGLALMFNVDFLFGDTMNGQELDKMRIMMGLMSLNLAFTFPLSIYGAIITARERFVFLKVMSIFRMLLNPVMMIILLLMGYKAIALVVVTTVLNLVSLLINAWYCYKKLEVKFIFKRFDFAFLKEVSIYSLWIFLNAIMDKVYWSSGQFILGIYKGAEVVAIYALAMQLKHMYFMFSTAISGVFLPKVTAMVANKVSDREISDLFIRTGRIQYIVISFILSAFIVLGRPFITLWAGAEYDQAYIITVILFVASFIPLIQNMGIIILQARNQMKFRSILFVIISILSIAVAVPMAKAYAGLGCAIATGSALVLGQGIILNIYYSKVINLDILGFWKEILKMSLVPIGIILVGLQAVEYVSIVSIPEFLLSAIIFSLIFIPFFWIFSMNKSEKDLVIKPLQKFIKR